MPYPHRNHYLLEISSLFIISLLFWRVLTHMFVSLNRHIVELHVNGVTGRVFLCTSVYSISCSHHPGRNAYLWSIHSTTVHSTVWVAGTTTDLSVLPLMDIQVVSSFGLSQQYCCCVSWCMWARISFRNRIEEEWQAFAVWLKNYFFDHTITKQPCAGHDVPMARVWIPRSLALTPMGCGPSHCYPRKCCYFQMVKITGQIPVSWVGDGSCQGNKIVPLWLLIVPTQSWCFTLCPVCWWQCVCLECH